MTDTNPNANDGRDMATQSFDDIKTRILTFAAPDEMPKPNPNACPLQQPSRCEATMDEIKSFIIRKGLKPGDPLPNEVTLCDELGVSRSSVREAIRKLEALHFVRVAHGKGMFVGDLSLESLVETLSFRAMIGGATDLTELKDVIQIRRILDLGVAQSVIDAMKGTEQPRLLELADQMEVSAEGHEMFLNPDIEFHSIMCRAANNTVLTQLASSLWLVHMAILPQIGLAVSNDLEKSAQAHKNMVLAAINGDIDGYRDAVIAHYQPIEGIVDAYLQEQALS